MKNLLFILFALPLFSMAQFHVAVGAGHDVKNLYTAGYSAGAQVGRVEIGVDFRLQSTATDFKNGGLITNDFGGIVAGYVIGNTVQLTPYIGYYLNMVEQTGSLGYSLKLEKRSKRVISLFIEGTHINTTQFQVGIDLRNNGK